MRLTQALGKLGKCTVHGYDLATQTWKVVPTKAILESSQRWISERVGFNARRVLLTSEPVLPYYVVKISDDDIEHILYSEQRNIQKGKSFVYDYTLLDKTHGAQIVTFTTTQLASGMQGELVEELSTAVHPLHLVRYAKSDSVANDAIDYSRSYGFIAGNVPITTDNELLVGTDRYLIEEAEAELLTTRLMLIKR